MSSFSFTKGWTRLRFWLGGVTLGFLMVLLIGGLSGPGMAQTVSTGTIAEVLDGTEVFIQNNQAHTGDIANRGQNVRTGQARAQVNFNTGAVARLSNNSSLTVGQCAQLQRGVLLVNGAVNGCTSSVTAGVRGTTYTLAVDEAGHEQITVLEGEVVVTKADVPESAEPPAPTGNEESITLTAGEKVTTRRGDRLSSAERLTAEEFAEILLGELFDGFLGELPGLSRIRQSFQDLYPNFPFPLDGSGVNTPDLPSPDRPSLPF